LARAKKLNILKKKILIAGSAGLVGYNALDQFSKYKSYKIFAIYNKKKPLIKHKNIKYIKSDLSKFKNCIKVLKNIDDVYMFAGKVFNKADKYNSKNEFDLDKFISLNINMMRAACLLNVKNYCWLSSFVGYPNINNFREENYFKNDPVEKYRLIGTVYRFLEKSAKYFALNSKKTKILTLRPSEIFGPKDNFNIKTCHSFPKYINKIVNLKKKNYFRLLVTENYLNKKNYIFVKDLVNISHKLVKKNKKRYDDFNVAMRKNYSLKQMIQKILKFEDNENRFTIKWSKKKFKNFKNNFNTFKLNSYNLFIKPNNIDLHIKETINYFKSLKYEK
jgi:GDP-L-fucose synthase